MRSGLEFDYVLLIDADLIVHLDEPVEKIKAGLLGASYLLPQQSCDSRNSNVRLVSRHANPRYMGITHEALYFDGARQNPTTRATVTTLRARTSRWGAMTRRSQAIRQ